MGQTNCKGFSVAIPTKSKCFPHYSGEKNLTKTCIKAAESMSRFREIASVASSMVMDAAKISKMSLILTITVSLIKLTLDQLANSNEDGPEIQGSMEDALIQMKIDKNIAQAAVSGLRAKLVALGNRYDRLLLTNIPEKDRRLEVIPALTLCEEILQLFRDKSHVFAKNPLISAPFVVSFGGVYLGVAELGLAILPSYRVSLVKQMQLLKETLVKYSCWCLTARADCLSFKMRDSEQSMLGVGVEGAKELYLDDPFLRNSSDAEEYGVYMDYGAQTNFESEDFVKLGSREEAMATYKRLLEERFQEVFGRVIQSVSSFSGFCGGELDDDDQNICKVSSTDEDDEEAYARNNDLNSSSETVVSPH